MTQQYWVRGAVFFLVSMSSIFMISACSWQDGKYDKEALEIARSYFASKWIQCGDRLIWRESNLGGLRRDRDRAFYGIKNSKIRVNKVNVSDFMSKNGILYAAHFQLYSDYQESAQFQNGWEWHNPNSWYASTEAMPVDDAYNGDVQVTYRSGKWFAWDHPVPETGFEKTDFTCSEAPHESSE